MKATSRICITTFVFHEAKRSSCIPDADMFRIILIHVLCGSHQLWKYRAFMNTITLEYFSICGVFAESLTVIFSALIWKQNLKCPLYHKSLPKLFKLVSKMVLGFKGIQIILFPHRFNILFYDKRLHIPFNQYKPVLV